METLLSFFGDDGRAGRGSDTFAVPDDARPTPEQLAVIAEACTRSGVLWVRVQGSSARHLAWHVWHEEAVHIAYGIGEQQLPMLTGPIEVSVPSKENRSTLVVFYAAARVLGAGGPDWASAAAALRASRLNASDRAGEHRWEHEVLISRLQPIAVLALGAGTDDAPSGAVPVRAGRRSTTSWRPWHLGGRGARPQSRPESRTESRPQSHGRGPRN